MYVLGVLKAWLDSEDGVSMPGTGQRGLRTGHAGPPAFARHLRCESASVKLTSAENEVELVQDSLGSLCPVEISEHEVVHRKV